MTEFIYGHWSIMETLRAGRRQMEQILLTETDRKSVV